MQNGRKTAAHERVRLARVYGHAARQIDNAIRGLDNLVNAGARHAGGHRSGKRWIENLDELALGHWENAPPPTRAELEQERRIARRIREILEPQVEIAWDLGVSLPEGHPFAPEVDGKRAA